MSKYLRKRNVILNDNKEKTVAFSFDYINEAKRKSLELQRAGHIVRRIAANGGRK